MLLLVLAFAGCDNGSTTEADIWSDVTSKNQLNGKWKGQYSETMTIKQLMEEEDAWDPTLESLLGGITVTVTANLTAVVSAANQTLSIDMIVTQKYSGGNIKMAWFGISPILIARGYEVDNKNYSATIKTQALPETTFTDDEVADVLNSGLKINQHGTRLLIPEDFMGYGLSQMIFTKQ